MVLYVLTKTGGSTSVYLFIYLFIYLSIYLGVKQEIFGGMVEKRHKSERQKTLSVTDKRLTSLPQLTIATMRSPF
jgi:hypothetical protein